MSLRLLPAAETVYRAGTGWPGVISDNLLDRMSGRAVDGLVLFGDSPVPGWDDS
jgi:hypothetical protein